MDESLQFGWTNAEQAQDFQLVVQRPHTLAGLE
jgi:hypothetical protein